MKFQFTLSLNDVKFPCVGGLHDMTAVFPLRTDTDKFDGGSGAEIKGFFFGLLKFISCCVTLQRAVWWLI